MSSDTRPSTGAVKRNPVTQREVLGHIRSEAPLRLFKKIVANAIGFTCCALIIFLSFSCYSIRNYQSVYTTDKYDSDGYIKCVDMCEGEGGIGSKHAVAGFGKWWKMNNFKMASAFANLLLIQVAEVLYKGKIANKVTEWENFRTDTEFHDALIQKTVLFEFVNNYFALVRNAPETPLLLMKSLSDPSETVLSRAVLYCVLNPDQFWTQWGVYLYSGSAKHLR